MGDRETKRAGDRDTGRQGSREGRREEVTRTCGACCLFQPHRTRSPPVHIPFTSSGAVPLTVSSDPPTAGLQESRKVISSSGAATFKMGGTGDIAECA